MYRFSRKLLLLLTAGLLVTICLYLNICPASVRAQSQTPAPEPPPGFYLLDSANGVQLYRKDYPNGNPDFVQLVNLRLGAKIGLMYGQISEPRPEKGAYGGADPRMTSLTLDTYWKKATNLDSHTFCVANGLFFYMPEYPTRLAFPLKVDGRPVADGWGFQTYPDQKLLLELWDDHAEINPLTSLELISSTAPNLIGGLTEDANKRIKYSVGRTFVGIANLDGDSQDETVLVFNSASSLQSAAADVLRSFGASQVMMLDGGGSTQLLCQSGWHIRSDRPIPQALAVIAAPPPPVASQLVAHQNWEVIATGSSLLVEFTVQNTGALTWTASTLTFYLTADGGESTQPFSMPGQVAPGQMVTVTHNLTGFDQSGVQQADIEWGLTYQQQDYPGQSFQLDLIVLPVWLADRKGELLKLVQQWRVEQPEQVAAMAKAWLDAHQERQAEFLGIEGLHKVRLLDIGLIVLVMLPVAVGLALVIGRIQR